MKKRDRSRLKSANTPADKKKAENNILLVNCGVIIYALILAVIYGMMRNSDTVIGAYTVMNIFSIGGIIAAMLLACYSAYVSKKSFLKYSLMCIFVTISSWSVTHGASSVHSFAVVALALAAAFVCNLIYAYLTDKGLYYANKSVRNGFRIAVLAVYAVIFILLVLVKLSIL